MSNQQGQLVDQGIHEKQKGNFDQAIELYDQAINMGEEGYLSKAYYNKGVLLDQCLSKPKEALACYEQAISMDPEYQKAWHNIGHVLLNLNEYQEALYAFEESLALSPDDVFSLFNMAYALNRLTRQREALDILKLLEEREVKNGDVYNKLQSNLYVFFSELGNSYLAVNNIARAYEYFEKAFALLDNAFKKNEQEYAICYNIAFIADHFKDYDKALGFYDKAISINENEAKGYQGKACTYIHTKQFKDALILIEKAIALNPKNFEAYYNQACAYAGISDKKNMLMAVQKTIELAPQRIQIYNHIKNDPDFKEYVNDKDFIELTNV
jgi:tetratricopeptide (TPR) repeat protein